MKKDQEIYTSQCILFEKEVLELIKSKSIPPRICAAVFGEILMSIIFSLEDPKDGLDKFLASFKDRYEEAMMKKYPMD